jgi:hypothetical protein
MWSKVNTLLTQVNVKNCEPAIKTMNFLKQNMVYCFDPSLRAQLRYQMDQFEAEFFQKKKEPVHKSKP